MPRNKHKSAREMRRLQARKDAHELRMMEASPLERKQAALFRNGITHADVQRETKAAFNHGKRVTEDFVFHTVYAAIVITMVEKHGWSQEDVAQLLRDIDSQVVLCIEDQDLTKEAYEKTGISINWDEPVDRIQEE